MTVQISGPDTAQVGSQVQYEIEVQNQSDATAAGLLITDRFDVGLEHAVSASPIERDLPELAPRTSQKVIVTFRVTRPGQLCQNVEVNGPGVKVTANKCLTATGAAGPANLAPTPSPGAQPVIPPTATSPPLSVRKTGPAAHVGEIAEFNILVTNNGTVALQNLRVADNYETSLEPDAATRGWEPSGVRLGVVVSNARSGPDH